MPKFPNLAFTFGPEFGARLRALRKARDTATIAGKAFDTWRVQLPSTEPKTV